MQQLDFQSIIIWLQNLGSVPIVVFIVTIYTILMTLIKRLNKDKDEVVPLLDSFLGIPLKLQKTSLEYHKIKKQKYKEMIDSDKAKEKYKEYRKNKSKKRQKVLIESLRKMESKTKTVYQKMIIWLKNKWNR